MTLKEIAETMGMKLTYGKYRMWSHVPFIGNTAMVIDETVIGGGQGLIYTNRFPCVITADYIRKAVRANAYSLGAYNQKPCKFTPFTEITEPASGYYTHKIGW